MRDYAFLSENTSLSRMISPNHNSNKRIGALLLADSTFCALPHEVFKIAHIQDQIHANHIMIVYITHVTYIYDNF